LAPTRITVFSDFSCPHSYLTEQALRRLAENDLEIEYRAVELYPEPHPLPDRILSGAELEALNELAAKDELSIPEVGFLPRTRKAHEASRFARAQESEPLLREQIYRGYWEQGLDIGRIDVLTELAKTVGLDPEELKIALDIDRYSADVDHDEEVAQRLRIPGTPTIFIGTGATARVAAGAHDTRQLRNLIHDTIRTWADTTTNDDG
jgi:predicted DsbA family dithiol-disulfide isomerase